MLANGKLPACGVLFALAVPLHAADPGAGLFESRIRPVLTRQCAACHSSQLKQPSAGLRLDLREGLLAGGKSGPAAVPGNAAASLLMRALEQTTGAVKMPPSGKLPDEVIADFRKWIDLGAAYDASPSAAPPEKWWSLRPIVRPVIPGISADDARWARTPIDRFIAAKLREKGLAPSAEADRRTLLRRVYFDLTGLPPSPEELAAFLADTSANAYEKVVDRLLESPRLGERWARHWMDVAHFAETDGYESDFMRPNSWPYRDYLIRSFNEDKPYSRFIQEQVAGDILFPSDPAGVVATGFLAAGPFDSNTIPPFSPDRPDVLRAYALDRDDMVQTVMSSFTSLTVHCARCHDHKFDPIPHKDYYALQAIFAGVDRAERPYDSDPRIHQRRQELTRLKLGLDRGDPDIQRSLQDPKLQSEAANWAGRVQSRLGTWSVVEPESVESKYGQLFRKLPDSSVLASGPAPESDTMTIALRPGRAGIRAVRLEFPPHESLPLGGPGRSSQGSFVISEIRLVAVRASDPNPVTVCIRKSLADYEADGSRAASLADGRGDTSWRNYPRHGEYRQVVLPLHEPLDLSDGAKLFVEIDERGVQMIGRIRVSLAYQALPDPLELVPEAVSAALAVSQAQWSDEQKRVVAAQYLKQKIGKELAELPKPNWVYAATNDFALKGWFAPVLFPRPIHVLQRGEVEKPGEAVGPGALSCVNGLASRFQLANPNEEGQRRAALAKWISDPANPLTWRSIVNRIWHYHFGRGIVDTPNDFGRMGGQPAHPELLDWLAAEFVEKGGSLKQLHRLIVTSSVYRQSSRPQPQFQKIDADNRYLWRMNRSRLDAESLRDAVLEVSGRLNLTTGGPSVTQAVVGKGVAGAPAPDYAKFDWDAADAGRRSVYRYLFRTLSDPFMDTLNCPNGSTMTGARTHSVDALQALALLNNPFLTRQAERLAERVRALGETPESQVRALYRVVLLRDATATETEESGRYLSQHGLANLCRVLLNSNEFVFVN